MWGKIDWEMTIKPVQAPQKQKTDTTPIPAAVLISLAIRRQMLSRMHAHTSMASKSSATVMPPLGNWYLLPQPQVGYTTNARNLGLGTEFAEKPFTMSVLSVGRGARWGGKRLPCGNTPYPISHHPLVEALPTPSTSTYLYKPL